MLKFHRGDTVKVRGRFNRENHNQAVIQMSVPSHFLPTYSRTMKPRFQPKQFLIKFHDGTMTLMEYQRLILVRKA